jgi:flagellar basal body-associated protein FliL
MNKTAIILLIVFLLILLIGFAIYYSYAKQQEEKRKAELILGLGKAPEQKSFIKDAFGNIISIPQNLITGLLTGQVKV